MNEDKFMHQVQMVDSSSEEEDAPPPIVISKPANSPQKQDTNSTSVGSPQKAVAFSSAGPTMTSDVRPAASKPILIRPAASAGANGSFGVKAVVSLSPANYNKLAVRPPSLQNMVKTAPTVKWTQAVPRTLGNPAQRGAVIMSTPASQQSQLMSSSGTGTSALNAIIGGNRQLNKTYIVNPNATGLTKTVNISPAMYLSQSTDGQGKIVGTTLVQQKDGRIVNPSMIRPMNVLNQAGGKVLTSSPQGTRCVAVQGNRFKIMGGSDRRVVLKTSTQMIRPQPASSGASTSVSQPLVIASNTAGRSLLNTLPVSILSTGAPAILPVSSTAPPTSNVSVGLRSPPAVTVTAGSTSAAAATKTVAGSNLPPGATLIGGGAFINAGGTINAGAATISAGANFPISAGTNLPPGAKGTYTATVTAGTKQLQHKAIAVTGQSSPAQKTPVIIPVVPDSPVVNTSVVHTPKAVIDAKSVENSKKRHAEVFNSQDSNTTSASDSQNSNTSWNSHLAGAKSRDTNIIDNDPKEVEPPEKKPALRKATILSGTKLKVKKSLLNGATDSVKPSSVLNEMANKSPSGVERIRKRKDNHKPAAVGEPPQKLLRNQQLEGSFLTAIPGAENLKAPTNVIKWDGMGLGMLPGSTIRFIRNAEGMLEVHEPLLVGKMEFIKQNGEKLVKQRDPQEIYCCVVCSCYGLLSEFNSEQFCSGACHDSFLASVDKISLNLIEEPTRALAVEDKKATRRKITAVDDKNEAPPVKQAKLDNVAEDSNHGRSRKLKNKPQEQLQEKADEKKPGIIKGKNMDLINASQSATPVRQLRTRETVAAKPMSKYVAGQDLEGEVSDDDEKIKIDNVDPFPWAEYLVHTESKPAWIKLFPNMIPADDNPFKIGFKLEAIDPERQGLFCAATVADVQGHRLKVHFDGYLNKYDFWTNIDSPSIFECGFCERHSFTLQPPCGMKKSSFNWATYQAARNVRPCPLYWFRRISGTTTNMFRPGMKLEAVDRRNTQLICVATCVGVLENRILVHFDSWSDVYDYWVDTSSPYIHNVGWCKSRHRELTPPNYYNPATFSWDAYLKETKSEAAPLAAFTIRPPVEWKKNTKLEVTDKRAPHLLRVATIKEVLPYQIKIAFDGFPDHFGYWVDDDSTDIHPTNWGLKTGHQLSGPPEPYRILNGTCPTPGCVGDGNWKGLDNDKHTTVDECPYSNEHLNAESPLQDRMTDRKSANSKEKKKPPVLGHDSDSDSDGDPETKWKFLDAAYDRTDSKGRLTADGTLIPVPKKTRVPYVLPLAQTFTGARPAVLKSLSTGQILLGKADDESGNVDRNPQGRRLERRGSDRSQDSDMSSHERKCERKTSDKNFKATPRRSLPAKTAAGVQAGSPVKGRAFDVTSTNTDRLQPRKTAKADTDVLYRVKTKLAAEPALNKAADILFWNSEQCTNKIKDLPPKCQTALKKLKLLTGERFLLLEQLFGHQLFENLNAAEKASLSSTLTSLQRLPATGQVQWKPRRANSRFGNATPS